MSFLLNRITVIRLEQYGQNGGYKKTSPAGILSHSTAVVVVVLNKISIVWLCQAM